MFFFLLLTLRILTGKLENKIAKTDIYIVRGALVKYFGDHLCILITIFFLFGFFRANVLGINRTCKKEKQLLAHSVFSQFNIYELCMNYAHINSVVNCAYKYEFKILT